VILDCAGLGTDGGKPYLEHLAEHPLTKYVTLKSPLLKDIDSKGPLGGGLASLMSLVSANLQPSLMPRLAPIRWAFFLPLPPALREITALAAQGKVNILFILIAVLTNLPEISIKIEKKAKAHQFPELPTSTGDR